MKTLIEQTIELLKARVKENLEQIKKNQLYIKEILNEPTSDYRTKRFEEKYNVNKSLLSENNDFINIQVTLINFLEKYKRTFNNGQEDIYVENVYEISSKEDAFDLTVEGKIPFNEEHPYFDDDEFFQDILIYYQNAEEYEMCKSLLDIRKKQEKA